MAATGDGKGNASRASGGDPLHAIKVDVVRHEAAERVVTHPHELFQTSTIEALMTGKLEGDTTVAELVRKGNLGLGTFDRLDGELIVCDGVCWAVRSDGTASRPGPEEKTPFAVVANFEPTVSVEYEAPMDGVTLEEEVRRSLVPSGLCAAVRLDGSFEIVRTRAPRKQRKPYPDLATATKTQSVFDLRETVGSAVGFVFPDYLEGLEVPGWHIHYLDTDRTVGGHILEFHGFKGRVSLDLEQNAHVELPDGVDMPEAEAALLYHGALVAAESGC